jgi:Protein of unknown function (DUF3455)
MALRCRQGLIVIPKRSFAVDNVIQTLRAGWPNPRDALHHVLLIAVPAVNADQRQSSLQAQATFFNNDDKQVITSHFLSANPFEEGTPRATWQRSQDTSTVWAMTTASSSDPNFIAPGAIPWLLLQVVGAQDGPTGGHTLTATTFMQPLNTSGGIAPSTGCTFVNRRRHEGVGALHGRLLPLQGRLKRRGRRHLGSLHKGCRRTGRLSGSPYQSLVFSSR